jgi:hypothetical protein
VLRYAARFGACLLTMEALLHAAHVVAIKDARAWAHAGPAALAMVGFWNLIVVWLKVRARAPGQVRVRGLMGRAAAAPVAAVPAVGTCGRARPAGEHGALRRGQLLRARLLARVAPLVQPLARPVGPPLPSRSTRLTGCRYIHVPLGGAKRVVLSTLLVFSFVALWHDLSMTLLAWGWLVSAFVLPELAARRALPATQVSPRVRPPTNVRVG